MYFFAKTDKFEIVEVLEGPRMSMRIEKVTDIYGLSHFRVQYQYSKKNNIWKNYTYFDYRKDSEGERNNGWFEKIGTARAQAKRRLKANN
ncbi:hypothetical protein Ab1vBOLIVR5_gp56c [Agrobacterium phage OLIVR5]|uniref:Uncharacterized protein n=2 Tax=Caudoviricetes TaxID=2731619 RepID=A0A858MSF1_9CAUD|nr:hypothetical protein KNU99_gp056 [Agrobacterium phage OLIVR5]QIW87704.1 hypothetical protein Ab1vBOLIVR5_gp56c [Agrobacterium phage OLIVR5]QIW87966.1 hypothetical protein Ab1vBOLIVR6_gp59c [Agrobacterium phage OLIVR6]